VERNKVTKEVRNHLQELAKESIMVIEERDSISYEREEQTEDPT
jgi:hypothetical protein